MRRLFTMLMVACILLAGCSSSYRIIRNETDKSATWADYRTFAFIDTARIDPMPGGTYRVVVEQVRQAVATELKNRGYQQTNDNPDLLVNIGAVVKEKTQTRQTTIYEAPIYTGQRRYHWQSQDVPVGTYQEGTVSLHFVDAQRNELVWDVAILSVLGRGEVVPTQVHDAIKKVFDKFPGKHS
ncbi:DUF4136 domain-containing protein [Spirosoma sp. SC4-14]|uniref:DUF4136 domain-containing protein n=1 Tax=Spirosoma sp. SC4-14 TaxID=3128900 RepID=UPI0030D504B1